MIANYHTHTWRCSHAVPGEELYVHNAVKRGLRELGFSDHSPYAFPQWYRSGFRMKSEQLDDYVQTVRTLQEKYRGKITIHLGFELEYYPDHFSQTVSMLRDVGGAYLLLGQHFVGSEIGEHYCGAPTADPDVLKRYCAQVMDAMNMGLFTYLAHPDLIRFVGDRKLYLQQLRQVVREAKSCAMPLEINLLGLADGRHYPARDFWELAAEEGCPVILGCDAHAPAALLDTGAEEKALAMARELGLQIVDTVELRKI